MCWNKTDAKKVLLYDTGEKKTELNEYGRKMLEKTMIQRGCAVQKITWKKQKEKNIKGVEPKHEGFLGLVGAVRVVIILNSGSLIPGPLLLRRGQQAPSLLLLLQRQSLCLCLRLDLSRGLDLGLQLCLELQLLLHGHHGHGLRLLEQLLLLDNHLLREGKGG